MIELMKELGFIPESRALKLYILNGKVVAERYDRVTYLREAFDNLNIEIETPVYVESGRFIPLIPFIRSGRATETYLQVILGNGAEYKFPYVEVEFERPELPDIAPSVEISQKIDLSILKKTALQNLVKPEMRCIYVDENGAVSCDFLRGTVDRSLRSRNALLLSPDLIDYIPSGEEGLICTIGDFLFYTNQNGKWIWAPKADLEVSDDLDEPWYQSIYNLTQAVSEEAFSDIPQDIENAIKRLQFFADEAEFCADKIKAGENFEPISIPTATGGIYTLDEVASVISYAKKIAFNEGAMYLKNGETTILVSEKEDE